MFVIYHKPNDFPEANYAVREWHIVTGETEPVAGEVFTASTLDKARKLVPLGYSHMNPHPTDDPKIKEIWL